MNQQNGQITNLVIFDVCNTLIRVNSTEFFINYCHKNHIGNNIVYRFISSKRFFYSSLLLKKLFKIDFYRKCLFIFFKGIDIHKVDKLLPSFFEKYINYKTKLFNNLLELKNNKKNEIILLSASVQQPIKMMGKLLKIKRFSTILEDMNGRFTGNVKIDLYKNKESILKKFYTIKDYNNIIFYTDDFSDLNCINYIVNENKEHKIYIIIKNNKDKKFWLKHFINKNINYEFL